MSPQSQRQYLMQIEALRAENAELRKDAERALLLLKQVVADAADGFGPELSVIKKVITEADAAIKENSNG